MKKQITINAILLAWSFILLTGCATVPQASEQQDAAAKTFSVPSGKANIYVYRPTGFGGGAFQTRVLLNGKVAGPTASGTFMFFTVPPGSYTVSSLGAGDTFVTIEAVAGMKYFIRQRPEIGVFQESSSVRLVSEQEGMDAVRDCALTDHMPNIY